MLRGFDVSFLTDWAALQTQHGISFGVARCMRSTEAKDASFDGNMQRMGELDDFVREAYMFASPGLGPDAVEDARLAWQYFKASGPLLPTDVVWLDLESSVLTQDETNDWAEEWHDEWIRIVLLDGYWYRPSLYNGGYLMNRTGAFLNQRFNKLWYPRPEARYDNVWPETFIPKLPLGASSWADTNWGRPPDMWQCSFHWQVPGYPEHDADVFNGTLDDLRSLNVADINLSQQISMLKADGTRTIAGAQLNLDSISVAGALTYGAASFAHLRNVVKPALDKLPDAIAVKLDNLADPTEVRAAVDAAINESGLKGLLPGV